MALAPPWAVHKMCNQELLDKYDCAHHLMNFLAATLK
jgi:hypothetical protein